MLWWGSTLQSSDVATTHHSALMMPCFPHTPPPRPGRTSEGVAARSWPPGGPQSGRSLVFFHAFLSVPLSWLLQNAERRACFIFIILRRVNLYNFSLHQKISGITWCWNTVNQLANNDSNNHNNNHNDNNNSNVNNNTETIIYSSQNTALLLNAVKRAHLRHCKHDAVCLTYQIHQ